MSRHPSTGSTLTAQQSLEEKRRDAEALGGAGHDQVATPDLAAQHGAAVYKDLYQTREDGPINDDERTAGATIASHSTREMQTPEFVAAERTRFGDAVPPKIDYLSGDHLQRSSRKHPMHNDTTFEGVDYLL